MTTHDKVKGMILYFLPNILRLDNDYHGLKLKKFKKYFVSWFEVESFFCSEIEMKLGLRNAEAANFSGVTIINFFLSSEKSFSNSTCIQIVGGIWA